MHKLPHLLVGISVFSISVFPVHAMEVESSIVVQGPTAPTYAYQFGSEQMAISLASNSHYSFPVTLTNLSSIPLPTDGINDYPLRLATMRPHDQPVSPFYDAELAGWVTPNRIRADVSHQVVPMASTTFSVSIKAPATAGKYLLALAPVVESVAFLPGEPLFVDVIVDGVDVPSEQYKKAFEKQLVIDKGRQRMLRVLGGDTVAEHIVSTGKSGYETPTGEYTIAFKQDVRYSATYRLYMDNWMALSSPRYGFVGYGIHKLPYWKTKQGRIYEGESHLGMKVSHGCVRLGYEDSKTVFDWSFDGMKVKVI